MTARPETAPPWDGNKAASEVIAALEAAGGEARYVGGCVRDWVLGRETGDIDIATTLVPEDVIRALESAGLKAAPTGLDHGTVTAIAEGQGIEVTTLRRDVETDGRRAVVGFTTDWAEDAARRDFTINALYADAACNIHDPTGQGMADAARRRLRFVGDAETRIREDYLRILRFFRFHAQIGLELDPGGLAACAALAGGLERLSVERVWHEMKRLLAGGWAGETLRLMDGQGVLGHLLPDCAGLSVSDALPAESEAIVRLAALLPDHAAAKRTGKRWRLSRAEARRLEAAFRPLEPTALREPAAARRAIYRDGMQSFRDRLTLGRARGETVGDAVAELAWDWEAPSFPLGGKDVMALGGTPGPDMGRLLADVEDWWVAGDFAADRAACLEELERRVSGTGSPESSPRRP